MDERELRRRIEANLAGVLQQRAFRWWWDKAALPMGCTPNEAMLIGRGEELLAYTNTYRETSFS